MEMWTTVKSKDYSLSPEQINEMNLRLENIKAPATFSRGVREYSKKWKGKSVVSLFTVPAVEYKNWVLYFFRPVMKGLLPKKYYTFVVC
jgi:hypothetical protein